MKTTIIKLLIICTLFLSDTPYANAQIDVADKQAIQTLKEFYIAYNTAWSTTKGYILVKKLDLLQSKYCTKKLWHEQKEVGDNHIAGSSSRDPAGTGKLDSLQSKYCTKKLWHEQKEIGLDHDLLTNDEYTDVCPLRVS